MDQLWKKIQINKAHTNQTITTANYTLRTTSDVVKNAEIKKIWNTFSIILIPIDEKQEVLNVSIWKP